MTGDEEVGRDARGVENMSERGTERGVRRREGIGKTRTQRGWETKSLVKTERTE